MIPLQKYQCISGCWSPLFNQKDEPVTYPVWLTDPVIVGKLTELRFSGFVWTPQPIMTLPLFILIIPMATTLKGEHFNSCLLKGGFELNPSGSYFLSRFFPSNNVLRRLIILLAVRNPLNSRTWNLPIGKYSTNSLPTRETRTLSRQVGWRCLSCSRWLLRNKTTPNTILQDITQEFFVLLSISPTDSKFMRIEMKAGRMGLHTQGQSAFKVFLRKSFGTLFVGWSITNTTYSTNNSQNMFAPANGSRISLVVWTKSRSRRGCAYFQGEKAVGSDGVCSRWVAENFPKIQFCWHVSVCYMYFLVFHKSSSGFHQLHLFSFKQATT